MIQAKFKYPNDPVIDAIFMSGKEFVEKYRGGGPGGLALHTDEGIVFSTTFDEIICDRCNALISLNDTCLLIGSYLYCLGCSISKMKYITED